ncbi:hypothetical protein HWC36_gp52 [Corynebacterium phage StAB]|uniref:Uncharacterized protein n=1 Tax=Corynebacterium phage StAB TaxID=2591204 RepID=A0A514DJF7_9CAUD|nr:hypothetical protein HWC36_gp52 [Corynebacterium phage StAB]QDH93763.1 hypothetical protein SEA_STAB_52 [Corynebacterium phage StAB]
MTNETTRPEVGQTIYVDTLVGRSRETKPLVVTRVGRKWFYAAPDGSSRERQFSLDTWAENTYMGRGPVARTAEEYAETQAHTAAVERLQATGYRIKGMSHDRSRLFLTTGQLNAISEIIEKGATE